MIQDSNAIRGQWKLGLVSKVFPGQDERVRKVEVQYKNADPTEPPGRYAGTRYMSFLRSVRRLVVLVPVEDREE